MTVSFDDCYRELIERGGNSTRRAFLEWSHRPGYEDVVKFVSGISHSVIFDLKPRDVLAVIRTTEHALGDVRKEEQIQAIEDFTCPFALQHVFHRFIERTGDVPTWERFWRWMSHQARPYWLDQLAPIRRALLARYKAERIERAVRWRLGKFYYSALRELDLLASVRARGIPLRYHVLADVLLRVDFWIGNALVCTYFPNPIYRAGPRGRKPPAAALFLSARPPFRIVDFQIERQGFGRTWLASESSKDKLAGLLVSETS